MLVAQFTANVHRPAVSHWLIFICVCVCVCSLLWLAFSVCVFNNEAAPGYQVPWVPSAPGVLKHAMAGAHAPTICTCR